MNNKRLIIIQSVAGIMLIIPLIAMQFTKEVDWDIYDFIVMGILLSGTGLLFELVLRTIEGTTKRLILCAAILFLFFITWAELAVGIFGSPFAGS